MLGQTDQGEAQIVFIRLPDLTAQGAPCYRLAKLFKSEEALAFISPTLLFYDRPAPRLASAILDLDRLSAERGRVLLSLYETPDDPLPAR